MGARGRTIGIVLSAWLALHGCSHWGRGASAVRDDGERCAGDERGEGGGGDSGGASASPRASTPHASTPHEPEPCPQHRGCDRGATPVE